MIGEEPINTDPLQRLRAAPHAKAKSACNCRFYSLYDKVYRRNVLEAVFQIVHLHACRRVRRWLRRKGEFSGQGYRQYPDSRLESELGLLNLTKFPRRYSWAKSPFRPPPFRPQRTPDHFSLRTARLSPTHPSSLPRATPPPSRLRPSHAPPPPPCSAALLLRGTSGVLSPLRPFAGSRRVARDWSC
jgi:hypothetical protein